MRAAASIASAAAVTITLIVARSMLRGNVSRGAYVSTSGGTGSVVAAFQDNAISGNGASGNLCR